MKWSREKPGVYTAGPYRVEKFGSRWLASGPSNAAPGVELDVSYERKDQAQELCLVVAQARAVNPAVTPVVGDYGVLADGRRGQLTAIMRGAPGGTSPGLVPLYCFRLPRGRRTCVFRYEFQVVMP